MHLHRCSGVLLHPTSLPGRHGVGTLGGAARTFVDFLADAGQTVWQVLPLGPTGLGDSPYNSLSVFAGNPLLIDPKILVDWGDLDPAELPSEEPVADHVDFARVRREKQRLLKHAASRFLATANPQRRNDFAGFCSAEAGWLDDFALFMAAHNDLQQPWYAWPQPLRHRDPDALAAWRHRLAAEIATERYSQYVFSRQWQDLKEYAGRRGVLLFGDLPIFVAGDSADVWAHQELFRLDADGQPTVVAGVPPDYFSATGQRWGNPLYRWDVLAATGYAWWLDRFTHLLQQTDLLRIDHFRGFEACWAIPADEPTAVNGCWEKVPGRALFAALRHRQPNLPIVAEDLGVITPEVEALRDEFGFPGMKILQFAFDGGADNPYLPYNYPTGCVVYTGTHDNPTTLDWWQHLDRQQQQKLAAYLGKPAPHMPDDLVRLAMASVAQICIIPCQDLLGLGREARFNRPGQAAGNWRWRLRPHQLSADLAAQLCAQTELYGRRPSRSA